jgi:hypothetical protein
LSRGEEGLPPLNPPSFLGKEMVRGLRGVNSHPKIGTKQPWVGWKKKAVKFDPVLDEKQKVSF